MQKSEKVAMVKNNIRQIVEKTRRKRVYGCLVEINYYIFLILQSNILS